MPRVLLVSAWTASTSAVCIKIGIDRAFDLWKGFDYAIVAADKGSGALIAEYAKTRKLRVVVRHPEWPTEEPTLMSYRKLLEEATHAVILKSELGSLEQQLHADAVARKLPVVSFWLARNRGETPRETRKATATPKAPLGPMDRFVVAQGRA